LHTIDAQTSNCIICTFTLRKIIIIITIIIRCTYGFLFFRLSVYHKCTWTINVIATSTLFGLSVFVEIRRNEILDFHDRQRVDQRNRFGHDKVPEQCFKIFSIFQTWTRISCFQVSHKCVPGIHFVEIQISNDKTLFFLKKKIPINTTRTRFAP
jgi:hypothetical protein